MVGYPLRRRYSRLDRRRGIQRAARVDAVIDRRDALVLAVIILQSLVLFLLQDQVVVALDLVDVCGVVHFPLLAFHAAGLKPFLKVVEVANFTGHS